MANNDVQLRGSPNWKVLRRFQPSVSRVNLGPINFEIVRTVCLLNRQINISKRLTNVIDIGECRYIEN